MKCIFCGKSAGFFKKEHLHCRAIAEKGKKYLRECIDYIYSNRDCMNITEVIADTIAKFNIPHAMIQKMFLDCWNSKVLEALEDGEIDTSEIKILREMLIALNINDVDLSNSKQWQLLIDHGKKAIATIIDNAIREQDLSRVSPQINELADSYGLSQSTLKQYVVEYWTHFLDRVFEDGVLDEDEERLLNQLADIFMFAESDVAPYRKKITQAAILRDVLNGIMPQRLNIVGQLPVVLQKKEQVIWLCNKVSAYEDKVHRHYVGGSTGISVRVAKGVYLRSGAFKGHQIETTQTELIGSGSLIITNKTIFWVSVSRSIKIPLQKLVSIVPYANGLVLQKDGVTAKPLTLIPDDPHFIYNLISNLNLVQ